MAQATIGGQTGNISFISAHGAAFASWRIRANHPVDDDTSYGDATATNSIGSSHNGSGVVDYSLTASGYLVSGAAGNAPGLNVITQTGGAVTCTAKTGCTEAGTFILTSADMSHAKRTGANPIVFEAINDGSLTETWAVS